ncbi:unnamed protein product [Paramecium pentaurelia]|uniref:MORN repeat protein n=1 Tax=Paramecium pentaurelia TaxID=43138 RepID=A0A8S1S3T7_9CILI|nr:unnamed protein product [Paramecium pentaurelia]
MYYPYNRPQYYPHSVYPPQHQPYRPQYYPPQYMPQRFPQQALYSSYNGFQIPRANIPPAHPMASQAIQSPNKNFQSPVRGFASPSRNHPTQSQQQQPQNKPPQQQQLQSPTRPGFLTYEQVMERIQKANSQQQQPYQPQQQQHYQPQQKSTSLPQPQQTQQKPQSGQNQQPQQQQSKQQQQPIQQQIQPNKTPNKQVSQQIESQQKQPTPPKDPEYEDGELEELALQYEDGYIYRGQGFPPQTRSGFGILTDSEGQEVYAGYWKDNFYEGEGKLRNLQVEILSGPYDYTNMTNIGNGWEFYEGKFEGGKMHGQGTLVLTNQEKYVGQFDDGMIHGEGEFIINNDTVVKAVWNQGILEQYIE